MTINIRTSPSHRDLVAALADDLAADWPDPFAPLPIVVANRAVERWLRHELATRLDIVANVEFPTWRATFDAVLRAVLAKPQAGSGRHCWASASDDDAWAVGRLRARLVELVRASRDEDGFGDVKPYLYKGGVVPLATTHRELSLAGEIAAVLDRLARERHDDALAFASDPATERDSAPAWLRRLCAGLGLDAPDSPASLRARVLAGEGRPVDGPPLRIFGLPPLSPTEAQVLDALSEWVPITVYRTAFAQAADGRDFVNPIARSFARADRAVRRLLPTSPPAEPWSDAADGTFLTRLQRWVRADAPLGDTGWPRDESLTFHRTYGPLRQVEVLRDLLLSWFADPTQRDLEPRDVLILTPDLATYGPLVAATFAHRSAAAKTDGDWATRAPAIPVHIADLGIASTNPLAEVLLALLELASERVTASRLVRLLESSPVRERFGLDLDDVADLRSLVIESGLRWGLDAADRARAGQPELEQNTIEFGLERLAFGVLMPEDGVEEGLDGARTPVVPLAVDGRERSRRIAALIALVRAVTNARARFTDPAQLRTGPMWHAELLALLDDVAALPPTQAWLRPQLEAALDEALGAAGDRLPVSLDALTRLLRGRFAMAQSGDRVITGAVTLSELRPGRTLPYKVIALLGMDDAAFPRAARPRAWDPFAAPRDGEIDPRDADRLALFESLMAASERFVVLWSGFDQKKGAEMPACVPIEELLGVVGRLTGTEVDDLAVKHPLQPWSPAAFNGGTTTFDPSLATAATTLRALARGKATPAPSELSASRKELLPPEENPPVELTLEDLARDLENPAKLFLYRRLDIFLPDRAPQLDDREPIELSSLHQWQVRDEAVRLLTSRDEAATAEIVGRRFAGRGFLPLEAGGQHLATKLADEAGQIRGAYNAWRGETVEREPISLQIAGLTLRGRPERIRQLGDELVLEWVTASRVESAKRKLTAWVTLLAARAAGWPVVAARIVGKPSGGKADEVLLRPPTPGEELRLLENLIAIWQLGRRKPLPLFSGTSAVIGEKLASFAAAAEKQGTAVSADELRNKLADAVQKKWLGDPARGVYGDSQDRWIAMVFANYDPTYDLDDVLAPDADGLVDLATRVWSPLESAKVKAETLANWLPVAEETK